MGKPVEPAILDGAQQIVVPAFVTLLVLDIVFAPMFQLGGVAGYLFRPLAEAVVFALIGSFILSRTLVPTMAHYLLHAHGEHDGADGSHRRRTRNPFKRFQQGFERVFRSVRSRYRALLALALKSRCHGDRRLPRLRRPVASASGRFWARTSSRRSIPARS